MKYIIMADGLGTRWNNYNNIPKHLVVMNGEVILHRVVRLVKKFDPNAEVIITAHDPRYNVEGATRYEPQNNLLEIDRFTTELIEDNVCFLYGDTYYTENAVQSIVETYTGDITFFGNGKSIVAVKVKNAHVFNHHVNTVRQLYLDGVIDRCIGWQVYQSYYNLPFGEKTIVDQYVFVDQHTRDINSPQDLGVTEL